jgi:hypothetical protein
MRNGSERHRAAMIRAWAAGRPGDLRPAAGAPLAGQPIYGMVQCQCSRTLGGAAARTKAPGLRAEGPGQCVDIVTGAHRDRDWLVGFPAP